MTILSLCENPDVLRIFKMINIILLIIKIAVPIMLIVSLMIEFIKPIISNKDELMISSKKAIKKIVAAILVFFIPTFINILMNIANAKNLGFSGCFANANDEYIANAYIKQAQTYIEIANKTESRSDYNKASAAVKNLTSNKSVVAVLKSNTNSNSQKDNGNDSGKNSGSSAGASSNGRINYRIKPITSGKELISQNLLNMNTQLKSIEKKVIDKEEKIKEQREIARQNAKLKSSKTGFAWPLLANSNLTACFGGNDSTHKAIGGGHGAIDMSAPAGTPVYASKDGRVVFSNYPGAFKSSQGYSYKYIIKNCHSLGNGGCANKVQIEHQNGVTTTYCHLLTNSITVKKGDYVKQGDKIGEVGSTGCSTGPHLHFALTDGAKKDPLNYVKPYSVSNPNYCGTY